jgi:hypothetical protein
LEFILGALTTIFIIVVANRILRVPIAKMQNARIRYSQSHVYSLISPILDYVPDLPKDIPTRQSNNFMKDSYTRVLILDDNAYWIKDQALYTAEIMDGMVNKETTRRVDTMTMDKVELDKTMFIVEKLREGLDSDSGGSGK